MEDRHEIMRKNVKEIGRWIIFDLPNTMRPFCVRTSRTLASYQVEQVRGFIHTMMPDREDRKTYELKRVKLRLNIRTNHLSVSFKHEADRIAFLLRWSDL